jgi:hypothetical protein
MRSPFTLASIARAVWNLVAVTLRTVRPVRTLQYVTRAVDYSSDNEVTGIDITLGTTLTDSSRAVAISANFDAGGAGAGTPADLRWQITSTTNLRIIGPNSTATAGLRTYAAWVVEYY